jgi:RNA polymerase sigma-70 factor (ECF subfamily)
MIPINRIIDGCKAGRQKEFRELYDLFASPMLGVCYRYSRNMEDAQDILQEGFVKVFKKIKDFRGDGSFEGWLRRLMVNTALNHYKANLKYSFHEEYTAEQHDSKDDSAYLDKIFLEKEISQKQILQIVQKLPAGYRMVFNMYVIDGLSHKEIAEDLKISENTSKSQLSKARKSLRGMITEKYGAKLHNII